MRTRWMIELALVAVCCVCVTAAIAGTPPVPIEGKLWVSGYDFQAGWYGYFLQGNSDEVTAWPGAIEHADISPLGDALAHQVSTWVPGQAWAASADVWVSALDGSAQANLTDAAGLSAINCFPAWSPDASKIAFQHCDPVPGQQPCETGFQIWVANADGTNAHRVSPAGSASMKQASWSADGRRLLCALNDGSAVTIGLDDSMVIPVPNLRGEGADVSPDGLRIAGSGSRDDVVAGAPGVWRELRVTDLDGGNPRTLVSQFVRLSDIEAHIARLGFNMSERDWVADIGWWSGPVYPQWSPKGDRIAFLAALPFDPDGHDYRQQVEVWVYTLSNGDLTRITNDLEFDIWLSWQGENTFPDSPQVTVDNTTVAFSEVTAPGLSTILWEESPPALPADYTAGGPFYRAQTTAQVSGPITLSMTYEGVAGAKESYLAILHYNEATSQWEDVTTSRDPAGNAIHGQTDSLSSMGLALRLPTSHFPDVSSSASNPFWALWDIEAAYAAGIVAGYEDGLYHPDWPVTRDQMAVYIARALAGGEDNVPAGPAEATFDDVPTDNWAYDHVEYCYEQNVVQGYTATTYEPTVPVTRDQMAVYVARSLVAPTGDAALAGYVPSDPRNFPDVPDTFWAYKHIEYCVENEVVQGYLDGSYHPEAVVTRDQMAVYVARAFGLGG